MKLFCLQILLPYFDEKVTDYMERNDWGYYREEDESGEMVSGQESILKQFLTSTI